MSRAYRLKVSETLRRVIRAEDHVSTQLELLDVLPEEQMAELLAQELISRGFERDGNTVQRVDDGIRVSVDLASGTVTVSTEDCDEVEVRGVRTGSGYDETRGEVRKRLEDDLRSELEKDLDKREEKLQKEMTDKLESQLADIRAELDQAANRATAEALKQKAAQIGQIKQISDDEETGELTIVVEV